MCSVCRLTLFCVSQEIRDEMRARHTELSYSEVLGKVSEAWKELGDDQKRVSDSESMSDSSQIGSSI